MISMLKKLPFPHASAQVLLAAILWLLFTPLSTWALDAEETINIQIYEKAAPAVVTITVMTEEGPSSGAGTIIDPAGIILTSSHVIGDANTAQITTDSGDSFPASVIARIGQKADLAILKSNAKKPLPYIKLGNSEAVRVGQKVLAIGNPYGFDRTLTLGIVSRLDKQRNRIQTDASINPGNSGGPLLNTDGEMIGINQSIFNPEGRRTNIGIGFAVPVNTAKDFIREIAMLPNPQHKFSELASDTPTHMAEDNIPIFLKKFAE